MVKQLVLCGAVVLFAGVAHASEKVIPPKIETPFDVNFVIQTVAHNSSQDSNPFLIDTNVVVGPAPDTQEFSCAAFDGTNYLLVWQDRRTGDWDIYGVRLNKSGEILDTTVILISTAAFAQKSPSVSFDGTNYLVVWEDWRSGAPDIYGARVSPTGAVLDPDGLAITTEQGDQSSPCVVFGDSNYLIVWGGQHDPNSDWDIYGARLNRDGSLADPDGFIISSAKNWQRQPSVAFDGINYFVIWADLRNGAANEDIFGARVGQTGIVFDTAGIPISTLPGHQWPEAVAFDGTNYLVIWYGGYNLYGSRVNQAGVVLDTAGIPISTIVNYQYHSAVVFDGSNYFVVWEDHRDYGLEGLSDIYCSWVSKSGMVLDTVGVPISIAESDQSHPCVAFDGTNYFVAWEDGRNGDQSDIYCARMAKSRTLLDTAGILISTATYGQEAPSGSFDGTNYFVAWEDGRDGGSSIFGSRVSQAGVVLDPGGFAVSTESDDEELPAVAFDGINFLTIWRSLDGIYGARVSKSGVVLDEAGITIATGDVLHYKRNPVVAFGRTKYLVIWEAISQNNRKLSLAGARIDRTGVVLDSVAIKSPGSEYYNQYSPSVAFDGTNYLVVWVDERSGVDIYGARVNLYGVVLDSGGIAISMNWDWQKNPAVAFGNSNYLVVWEDWRNGDGYTDIYGCRVSPTGTVLDPDGIPIAIAANSQLSPIVVWDGTDFLVAWQDCRSGEFDIQGVRVSDSGKVIESFPLAIRAGNQVSPAFIHGTGNEILVTYSGWAGLVGERYYGNTRIWGVLSPFTGVEEKIPPAADRLPLRIYPRPAKSGFTIHAPSPVSGIKIYDAVGKLVKVENYPLNHQATTLKINLKEKPSGIYFVKIKTDTKEFTEKVVIIK